jgi:hypothetical protein
MIRPGENVGRFMNVRFVPVLLATLSLTACGPKTVKSMFFPERYSTTTTVEFHDGGRSMTQTLRYQCKIIDETDSLAANTLVDVQGERHWLKRTDGSILVLGHLNPCPWTTAPAGNAHEDLFPQQQRFDDDSYLFDSADKPSRVDVLSTQALFATERAPWASGARVDAAKGAADATLHHAFPGLAALDPHSLTGRYVGGSAKVFRLTHGTHCDPTPSGVVVLSSNNRCNFVMPCRGRRERTSRSRAERRRAGFPSGQTAPSPGSR